MVVLSFAPAGLYAYDSDVMRRHAMIVYMEDTWKYVRKERGKWAYYDQYGR